MSEPGEKSGMRAKALRHYVIPMEPDSNGRVSHAVATRGENKHNLVKLFRSSSSAYKHAKRLNDANDGEA